MRKPLSKYKDFEDEEKEEGPYEFTGPLRVDNPDLEKRMEMLHTLMVTWNIKPWDFSVYLQRDIFKGFKKGEQPDEETYDDAISKLSRLRQQSAEKEIEEQEKEAGGWHFKQNNFSGISPDGILSLFKADVEPSKGGSFDVPDGHFTMASTKLGLWVFETTACTLVGINNPEGRSDYMEYINKLPEHAVAMFMERMEYYNMPKDEAVMFGVNGVINVLQGHGDLYCIVYPSGDIELTSNLNTTLRGEKLVGRMEQYMGRQVYSWLKSKFKRFTE